MMKSEFSQRDDKEKAREKALEEGVKRLNSRMRTEKELKIWLAEKGYDAEIINEVITRLKEPGYLNDEEYCRQYFFYSKKKGKADYRILMELEERGIPSAKGKEIFKEIRDQNKDENSWDGENRELDDRKLAMEIGCKMKEHQLAASKEIDEKFKAKVSRRLASLGYPSSTIYYVVDFLGKTNEE